MSRPVLCGIFGGSFDPIHYGHLRAALEVQQALKLEQIRFIPLGTAVHRRQPVAAAAQRLAMLQAAITPQTGFVVDEREIQHPTPSYTVDTLTALQQEYPHFKLCLLLGNDAWQNFNTWHRYLEILDIAHLIIMQRPGQIARSNPKLEVLLKKHQLHDYAHNPQYDLRADGLNRILIQSVTQLDISSTAIRASLAVGGSIRFLVPDTVLQIIHQEQLYSNLPD